MDVRELDKLGISELMWVYGTRLDWNGPQYWIDRCKVENRTVKTNGEFPIDDIAAGIALDEWVPSRWPEIRMSA